MKKLAQNKCVKLKKFFEALVTRRVVQWYQRKRENAGFSVELKDKGDLSCRDVQKHKRF